MRDDSSRGTDRRIAGLIDLAKARGLARMGREGTGSVLVTKPAGPKNVGLTVEVPHFYARGQYFVYVVASEGGVYVGCSKAVERIAYHTRPSSWRLWPKYRLYQHLASTQPAHLGAVIVASFDKRSDALTLEAQLIATFKRVAPGLCLSDNLGAAPSAARRRQIRAVAPTAPIPRIARAVVGRPVGAGDEQTFAGVHEAARATGASAPNISAVCRGKLNSTAGWRFRYLDPGEGERQTLDQPKRLDIDGAIVVSSPDPGEPAMRFADVEAVLASIAITRAALYRALRSGRPRLGFFFRLAAGKGVAA